MATAAAYGQALGIAVHGVCSLDAIGIDTAGEVLVVTDARRREVYWARYRDGVRIEGPAVNAPADVPTDVGAVAGSPEHAALFALPRQPAVYPTASGLVRVVDWTAPPQPLVPLYLRRPDAKPRRRRRWRHDGHLRRTGARATPRGARNWRRNCSTATTHGPRRRSCVSSPPSTSATSPRAPTTSSSGTPASRGSGESRPTSTRSTPSVSIPHTRARASVGELLTRLLEFAAGGAVYLEVRTDNAAAIGMYESAGFVNIGLRKRYYRASGADAYTMQRPAQGGPT